LGNEALESAPVERPNDQRREHPIDPYDLPDRWCFGLAHPYMQRLIFLAGAPERSPIALDLGDCRPGVRKVDT